MSGCNVFDPASFDVLLITPVIDSVFVCSLNYICLVLVLGNGLQYQFLVSGPNISLLSDVIIDRQKG